MTVPFHRARARRRETGKRETEIRPRREIRYITEPRASKSAHFLARTALAGNTRQWV